MADDIGNHDLLGEWQKVLAKYQELTKKVLSVDAPSTSQDLEARCNELSRSDRNELVKAAASSVFKVAQFAVEASPIFSHATIVFQALKFLGDTIATYRSAFTPNAVLKQLKGVGTCLGRMEGYLKLVEQGIELDEQLKDTILTVFSVTLHLCTTYTKVAKDSKRVIGVAKNVFKSAIRWDNGIASRLKEIEEESNRELNHNVAALRVSEIDANDSKTRKANEQRIRKHLAVGEGKDKNWAGRQAWLEDEHIQGMGDWLFQLPEFKSWANTEHHTDFPVLYLNAATGYGKSHLCAQAIKFLKNKMEAQQQQKKKKPFSLAWYFFPERQTDQQKSTTTMEKRKMNKRGIRESMPLLDALRTMVWQLAEADCSFQDFVVKKIEEIPQGMEEPVAVWTNLLNEYVNSSKQNSEVPQMVLFLVLDGYGKMRLQEPEVKAFTKIIGDVTQQSQQRTQFRILLAGNQDFSFWNDPKISEIGLSRDHQRQDAKLFIKASLKVPAYEYWNHESEEHRTLLEIRKDLSLYFEGDYHELKECLQEVERSSQQGLLYLHELKGTNLSQQLIKRKLETLSKELESNDIEVLNELIVCMVHWNEWPTVSQLNAHLTRRLGSKFKPPIEVQLEGKFRRLASVENGFVCAWKLLSFFQQMDGKFKVAAMAADNKLCDKHRERKNEENVLVPKCMMDLLFTQPHADSSVGSKHLKGWMKQRTISRPVVGFDRDSVKISTIKGFLQSICDNAKLERVECKNLFSYIAIYMPAHFSDVSGEEILLLEREEKEDLGRMLYRVFRDERVVEAWLPKGFIDVILLVGWEMGVKNVVKWLQDESVRRGFRNAEVLHSEGLRPTECHDCVSDRSVARAVAFEEKSTKAPMESTTRNTAEPRYDAGEIISKSKIEGEQRGEEISNTVNRKMTVITEDVSDSNIEREEVVDVDDGPSEVSSDNVHADTLEQPNGTDNSCIYLYELLEVPAKVVAAQWFQESTWNVFDTLVFLTRILTTAYLSKSRFHPDSIKEDEKRLYNALYIVLGIQEHRPANHVGVQGEEVKERLYDVLYRGHGINEPGLTVSIDFQDQKVTGPIEPEPCELEWRFENPEAVKVVEEWALYLLNITEAQAHRNTIHDLRLAETFMWFDDNEEGFEEVERRCELIKAREPLNIKAQILLIAALDCSRNRKRQALEELMKIRHNIQCASFKEADEVAWNMELNRFWSLCTSTNSVKEAFIACHHLSEEFPGEQFPLDHAQEWIGRQKKLDPSFEFISMRRQRDGRSLLSELFCLNARSASFHQKFYVAVKDRTWLVLETYEDAISASKQRLDTEFLRYHYGVALSRCGRSRDAMVAWEKSMEQLQGSRMWNDSQPTIWKLLDQVAEALGSAYLGILLNPKRSESPNGYVKKLELNKAHIDDQNPNGMNYSALLLARSYLHIGRKQKAVTSVEKHMSTAFSLLDDDTEDNDWKGYLMLAEALTSLEDDDNARAAWSRIVNVPDTNRICEVSVTCAGGCGWGWKGSDSLDNDLYICRNCPHVRFESKCRELLSKNGLKQHICGANHSFLTVRRRTRSDVRALEFNKVLVGKVEMNIDDWLDGLRHRYGIRRAQSGWPSRTAETLQIARWNMRRQTGTLVKKTSIKAKNVLSIRKWLSSLRG